MKKTKIRIIYTGGTIGGRENSEQTISHDLKTEKFKEIIFNKLSDIVTSEDIQIDVVTARINKFSEEMLPSDWCQIATAINNAVGEGIDGIVIAHGTDTMAYTTSAISYMLQGIKIPIAVTGSNKPISNDDTDAIKNLGDAILFTKISKFKGVFLIFSGTEEEDSVFHLGTRARKIRFLKNCYESINTLPIGVLKRSFWNTSKVKIKLINTDLLNIITELNTSKEYKFNIKIESKICFFKIYPGFDPAIIENAIDQKRVKGILLELYNSGTGCTTQTYSLLPPINRAKECNIPVYAVSQHLGTVDMESYGSAELLRNAGVVPLKDMITEAAIPKLMWVLGQTQNKEEITKLMLTNLSGEILP